jgi:hypothetical protein
MAKSTPGRRMSKRDFLREVDVQFARLFGELNPIPPRRTPSNVRQDAIGSDANLKPLAFPCCLHEAQSSREGFASVTRNPVEASKNV